MKLINWRVLFEEDLKIPGFKEEFDKGYEEFCKENAAELAAERMAMPLVRRTKARRKAGTSFAIARKTIGA